MLKFKFEATLISSTVHVHVIRGLIMSAAYATDLSKLQKL